MDVAGLWKHSLGIAACPYTVKNFNVLYLHSDFMLLVEIPWLHHNSLSLGENSIFKRGYFLFPGHYMPCSHVQIYITIKQLYINVKSSLMQHPPCVPALQFITSFPDNQALSSLKFQQQECLENEIFATVSGCIILLFPQQI